MELCRAISPCCRPAAWPRWSRLRGWNTSQDALAGRLMEAYRSLHLESPGVEISPQRARPGDLVLVNGPIAVHGIAIISVREGLAFETSLESDSAALHGLVQAILQAGGDQVHVLRDPTRGGVSSAVNEIAASGRVGIRLDERSIPISNEVRGACEILGLS